LEELGCRLDKIDSQKATNILNSGNFCFLFAQLYHPAMKYVAGPRKELGVRTIFNILGPLTNPASPRRMIVGVYSKDLGFIMAESLKLLKIEKAWVVCGEVGLDEISPEGKTFVWELSSYDDKIVEKTISPADFGLPEHSLKSVKGGSAADNAKIMNQLLDGKLQGPMLDFVLLNTAALLYVSDMGDSLTTCVNLARESISNGSARKAFDHFLLKSNQ
jgi:anthranilate phosphoribosyltransferase